MLERAPIVLKIRGLRAVGKHGLFDIEKVQEQPFEIDCTVTAYPDGFDETRRVSDENYICYAQLCALIENTIKERSVGLLETLCELVAHEIAARWACVHSIEIDISKPRAMMDSRFAGEDKKASVGYSFTRLYRFALSLGGNIGNREAAIRAAIGLLNMTEDVEIDAQSSFYETRPWGNLPHQKEQANYLNVCVTGKTRLTPFALLRVCKNIEERLGRTYLNSALKWDDRLIDIDIVAIEGVTMSDPLLTLPHKEALNRAFVLAPMREILEKRTDALSSFEKNMLKAARFTDMKDCVLI